MNAKVINILKPYNVTIISDDKDLMVTLESGKATIDITTGYDDKERPTFKVVLDEEGIKRQETNLTIGDTCHIVLVKRIKETRKKPMQPFKVDIGLDQN